MEKELRNLKYMMSAIIATGMERSTELSVKLENLTTGMYQDSKVIYRKYIQNACDQIDKAEQLGILRPRNTDSKLKNKKS